LWGGAGAETRQYSGGLPRPGAAQRVLEAQSSREGVRNPEEHGAESMIVGSRTMRSIQKSKRELNIRERPKATNAYTQY
jgi:hypothetical protein